VRRRSGLGSANDEQNFLEPAENSASKAQMTGFSGSSRNSALSFALLADRASHSSAQSSQGKNLLIDEFPDWS